MVNYKKMRFRDPVVQRVCESFVERSDVGYEKYGRTLNAERTQGFKDLAGYLNDVQEELMDAVLYIQAAREEVRDWLEEMELARMNVIGQNGNEGTHYNNSDGFPEDYYGKV